MKSTPKSLPEIKKSFFDNSGEDDEEEFFKTADMSLLKLDKKVLEGTFHRKKQGGIFSEWKTVYLTFYGDILIETSKKNEKSVKYIDFFDKMYHFQTIYTAGQKATGKFKYGFVISYGSKYAEYYVKEKNIYDEWYKILKKFCILHNYQEKFKQKDHIGTGGYGKVYVLEEYETSAKYAGKIINLQSLKNQERQKIMLTNEIQIMRKLDHESICKLIEVHETEEEIIMVIELIDGEKLFNYIIDTKKLSEKETALVIKQLLLILHYLESKEVIHRDLKPENILFTRDHRGKIKIKLIDFGLSTFLSKRDEIKKCGTAGYVAPEILNNENYDLKADIYSVGILMFICLSGRPPFNAMDYQELLEKNRKGLIKYKGKVWNKVTPQARDLLNKMLESIPVCRISLDDAINHDWLTTSLSYDDKEDLAVHAFKVTKMNVPEESKLPSIPVSSGHIKVTQSRSSFEIKSGSFNSGLPSQGFIAQSPSMQTLNSFYKMNTSLSTIERSQDQSSLNSFIQPGSKGVYVDVKRPTLTIPETAANSLNLQPKKAGSISGSETSKYKIQVVKFENSYDSIPSDGSLFETKMAGLKLQKYSFIRKVNRRCQRKLQNLGEEASSGLA